MDGYRKPEVKFKKKADGSIVTETDFEVSDYVQEVFPFNFQDCFLLTEEKTETEEERRERLKAKKLFIVDEIDGSGDFKRREKDFCFLCAYAEYDDSLGGVTPVAGVIYEPLKERMLFAEKGGPVYIEQAGTVTELPALKSVTWETSLVGHPKNYPTTSRKYDALYELMGIPESRLVRAGSLGTRAAQMLTESPRTHMILGYTKNMGEWDIAANHAVLAAAGFSVTDIRGRPLVYNKLIPQTNNGFLIVHPDIRDVTFDKLKPCYAKVRM